MPRERSNRMSKITRTGESVEAFREAPPMPIRKTTLDFLEDEYLAMQQVQLTDRIPIVARIRAMVALWREDPELAERVNRRAAEIRAETIRNATSGNRAGR